MKPSPLLSTGVLAGFVLLTRYNALADLDVWDGGSGSSNNISAELNWTDNTAPVSDLQNTDLIFSGANRLSPVVDLLNYRVHSITFFNVAGSFVISGQTLNMGTLGIGNEDNGMMTLTNPVSFAGVTDSLVEPRNGPLTFTNTVTLPAGVLRVIGDHATSFANIAGTSTLQKTGGGTMTWTPNSVTTCDVVIGGGAVTMGADGGVDVFSAAASIIVNDGDFNINESLTLAGARLTENAAGDINLAAGKTLTVQNGGGVVVDGNFEHSAPSNIIVTGAGSTFSSSQGVRVNGGNASVLAGGSLSTGSVGIGRLTDGAVAVSGIGSSLTASELGSDVGDGATGTLTFSGGSTGTFYSLGVASSAGAGTVGILLIQSGATVTVNSFPLNIANETAPVSGSVTIAGSGSTLTLAGGFPSELGAASTSTGAINVNSGGTLIGDIEVHPTGTITINDGTYRGRLLLDGGRFTRSAAGVIGPGSWIEVEAGGDAVVTGSHAATTVSLIRVSGPGSTFTTTADLSINTGSLMDLRTGGTVSSGPGNFRAGTVGSGEVTISGTGSTLTLPGASTANIGAAALGTGTMTISPGGTFQSGTGVTTVNATGTLAITGGTCDVNGDLTINGGRLTRDATGVLTLDPARTLTVQADGDAVFTGGFTTPASTSVLVTGAGSTLSTTGGALSIRDGGTLTIAAFGSVAADPASFTNIGAFGGTGTATVNGVASSFTGGSLNIGFGSSGSLEFQNLSSGNFTGISVANSAVAGTTGMLGIRSGATVITSSVAIAAAAAAATGTVIVSGNGSTLALSGALTSNIGAASASSATLTVESGGVLVTGTGLVNVHATGALNIHAGGVLTGAADYGGAGPIAIAGTYAPGMAFAGNQTTSASFAQNIALQPTSSIRMEIGGTAAGTQHDQIVFNGPGATQVTWNGTLQVFLINGFVPQPGQSFDLFNFDAARDAGVFTSLNLPALPAGLFWRTDRLYIDGTIGVRGPATYAEWRAAFGTGGFNADDDGDGFTNGIEFLLGTNPKQRFAAGERPWIELPPVDSATETRAGVMFKIPADPASDAFYRLFASSNLVNWVLISRKDGASPWSGSASVTAEPPTGGLTRLNITESLPRGASPRYHRLDALEPP